MSDTLTVRGDARGHMLIAERSGVPVAAISLTSGAVVAEPRSSAAATRLLRLRRYQLLRQGGEVGQRTSLLRRVAS
jgi:hypothetical protein